MHVPSWSSWSVDPVVAVVLVAAAALYLLAFRRARRIAGASGPGIGHALACSTGLVFIAVARCSPPLDPIGDTYLLSAHMGQHILLSDIAPAFLVLGLRAPVLPLGLGRRALPPRRARRARRPADGTRSPRPWVALPLWALATWLWAIPAAFDYAAAHPFVHALEHASLFYTGLAMWWLIVDPLPSSRRAPNGRRLAYLGFTRVASAGVCLPLVFLTSTAYPRYAGAARAYGISAITDQHLAGAGMCFLEFLVFGIAMAATFISFLSRDERRAALEDRVGAQVPVGS